MSGDGSERCRYRSRATGNFGWIVIVSRKPFLLWLGCGNTEDSADEWRIFPMAELSLFQRLLGRQNTALAMD